MATTSPSSKKKLSPIARAFGDFERSKRAARTRYRPDPCDRCESPYVRQDFRDGWVCGGCNRPRRPHPNDPRLTPKPATLFSFDD
jgi:hypothetical protein